MQKFLNSKLISHEVAKIATDFVNVIGEQKLKENLVGISRKPNLNNFFKGLISEKETIKLVERNTKEIEVILDFNATQADKFVCEMLADNYIFKQNKLCKYAVSYLRDLRDINPKQFKMQYDSGIYLVCIGWYILQHICNTWCLWCRIEKIRL